MSRVVQMAKAAVPLAVKTAVKRTYWDWRSRRLTVEPYVQGYYPPGVNLAGYIYAEMGLGQGCRCIASGLKAAKIPFSIINYTQGYNARAEDITWSDYVGKARFAVDLVQINADQVPQARVQLGKNFWDKRYHIAHFAWELPEFPSKWSDACDYFHEIWTPSTFCSNAIAKKTKTPVYTMPFVIQPEITQARDRNYFNLPQDCFLFLCMFDMSSVMERKNPLGAIRAFCQAFSKNIAPERVGLVVKINNYSNITKGYELLRQAIEDRTNIYIIDCVLSKNDVNALIQSCDVFVSLHRSEGFGLVMAEAMYFGRPVIATNWSSNTDFMNSESSCPVDYRLVPLTKDHAVYEKGQLWAQPDEAHCGYYMRRLYEDAFYYRTVSKEGQRTILHQYSPDASAQFLRDRLRKHMEDNYGN